jgi:hypothetical protein
MGTSDQANRGRRTSGHKIKQANAARQNANRGPDHPLKYGDFTKNPLVLHNTAAANTNHRACRNDGTPAGSRFRRSADDNCAISWAEMAVSSASPMFVCSVK